MSTKITKKHTNKNTKLKKRISPTVVAFIGTIIFMIGGFFLSYNYVKSKKVMAYDYMNNVFFTETFENGVEEENIIEDSDTGVPDTEIDLNNYIGTLIIDKINFNKGFYPKESELNNVDKNLLLVKESNYPNEAKGNLIIPIGSTGYAAKVISDEVKCNISDYPYLSDVIGRLETETDIDSVVTLVMDVIIEQQKLRRKE